MPGCYLQMVAQRARHIPCCTLRTALNKLSVTRSSSWPAQLVCSSAASSRWHSWMLQKRWAAAELPACSP